MNKLILSLAICILLAGCNGVTPVVPLPTNTPTILPTETSIPTIAPSPTLASTEITEPVYQVSKECITKTPSSKTEDNTVFLSDSQILDEFVGVYSMDTGFESLHLVINCDGSFIGWSFHDIGALLHHEGKISVKDGQIYLTNAVVADSWALPKRLTPVRWGQRRYLIADYLEDLFCESMALADERKEPRIVSSPGLFLLRSGDENLDVTGFPISPSGEKICP